MTMYDLNIGYHCDHRFKQFVTPLPQPFPTDWKLSLDVTLPPIGENPIFYKNEVPLPLVTFQRTPSPKEIIVQNLVIVAGQYPQDDYELEYGVVPDLCPKCKGLSPFGT